jgi:hypothetical protein
MKLKNCHLANEKVWYLENNLGQKDLVRNLSEFAREHKFTRQGLQQVADGKRKSYCGFIIVECLY